MIELEEMQAAKRKLDKEMEAQQDRIDELIAENHKVVKSKKKIQEEVRGRELLSLSEALTAHRRNFDV